MLARLALVSFLLVACDNPGGGGRVNCTQTPTAPACQVQTTSTPDTTSSNEDTTSPTNTDEDATSATTTSSPTDATSNTTSTQPDVVVPSCTSGNYRCVGGDSERCTEGEWGLAEICEGNENCNAATGRCECEPSCGGAECGDDGCGGSCGSCSGVETCVEGECSAPATNSCFGITTCINQQCSDVCDEPGSTACEDCKQPCIATGTSTAKSQYATFVSCFECTTTSCVNGCVDEVGTCLFNESGSDTCFEINTCLGSCSSGNTACSQACFDDGSRAGQGAFAMLSNCVAVVCGSDTTCRSEATAEDGQCYAYVGICQSN